MLNSPSVLTDVPTGPARTRIPKWLKWIAFGLCALLAITWLALVVAQGPLSRIAKERALRALRNDMGQDLQLQDLKIHLGFGASIEGVGLAIAQKTRKDAPPFIRIRRFTARSTIPELMRSTTHVTRVHLEGLEINVAPDGHHSEDSEKKHHTPEFLIHDVVADGTALTIWPRDKDKDPLRYDLKKLRLQRAGTSESMTFDAVLQNAKPPGEIVTHGDFGPWDTEDADGTPLGGSYIFQHADLSVFKGISGILSSKGSYKGRLGRIEVEGTTDVPDFALDIAGHPMHLTTQFHSIVDGTGGDTLLNPVRAQFGHSSFTANGGVYRRAGLKGRQIELDVTVTEGRLEDMLRLAVKSAKPPMSGAIRFHTRLEIPPGQEDVVEKLKLAGSFSVGTAHFSDSQLQQKMNDLSHRSQGEPNASDSETVASDFRGDFRLASSRLSLHNLSFRLPGMLLSLNGTYGLRSEEIDFAGKVRTEATISHMTTGFKSFLLKGVDPFFKKKGAGAELPIKIGGTRDNPTIGVSIFHKSMKASAR